MQTPTVTETTTQEASAPAEEQATKTATEQSASDSQPTMTEKLFPDFFVDGEITTQRQDISPEAAADEASEAPKPDVKPETKPEAKGPEYLDLTQISGKMVKVKVDGVEMDVPAEDVIKNYQLDRHLTQRGQSLSEKEKELNGLKDTLNEIKAEVLAAPKPGEAPAIPDARIESISKKIEEIESAIRPVVTKEAVEKGIERLDQAVRENLGYEDFRAKIPEIQAEISKNFKDPRKPTEEELAKFDTLAMWYQGFQTVKLRELRGKPAESTLPPKPAPKVPAGPVLDKKPVRPPVAVEEAGGASVGGENQTSAWKVQHDAAVKYARESGADEAWQAVFRLKREKPDS